MGNIPDSDLYATITYIDPLIMPQFIATNNWYSIRAQVDGDWLLNLFVCKLDQEIVDDIEEWKEKKETVAEIFDAVRTYGWCVYQNYAEFDKVFTPFEWTKWLTAKDEKTGKQERIGLTVHWTDDLGNTYSDDLYFDDQEGDPIQETVEEEHTEGKGKKKKTVKTQVIRNANSVVGKAYLFIWKKGNGLPLPSCPLDTRFAVPDVNLSILSLAIQCRQIQATLTFAACNPFFYQFIYGDGITPNQRKAIVNQMSYTSTSKGLGAKKSVLEQILPIENGAVEKTMLAIEEMIGFYAGATRLPLQFYMGEKQVGSGLDSGKAEGQDDDRLMDKKELILQHFADQLTEIASVEWGISLPDLYGFYTKKREEEKKEKEAQMQKEIQMKHPGSVAND